MFQPSTLILNHYADVLVKFALNSGRGIKKNEVVILQVPESAKPLLIALYQSVLQSGGHPLVQYLPDDMERLFFDLAGPDQISFFPAAFQKGKVRQADHLITIIAETNKHELEGIDPKLIMARRIAQKPYMEWRNRKEALGKFTWSLAMYATPAMAAEAGLSLETCWRQIIRACYLDDSHPVATWQRLQADNDRIKNELNKMSLDRLHVEADHTDLWIGLGPHRRWLGGGGRNIPSFELFISPDCRRTDGHISFDLPLYYFGQVIKDIYLEFKNGRLVQANASQGEAVLKEMINVKNADKIGEFSLTDKRFSHIDTFMAETLFDENYGGQYGNTHLALGAAYTDSFPGNQSLLKKSDWSRLGYNQSAIHTDIIATKNRTITAYLSDNSTKVIYRNGRFTL